MLYLPYTALLATLALAANIPVSNHVKLDFSVLRGSSKATAKHGANAGLVSKSGSGSLELINEASFYASTLKVGSNGDENSVVIDTGSSDLWVMSKDVACYNPPSSKRSFEDGENFAVETNNLLQDKSVKRDSPPTSTNDDDISTLCTSLGSFNTEASTSFKLNSSAPLFEITYGDGTFANGVWGTDFVSMGPFDVPDVSLAVVNETTSQVGVFGIGLSALEVTNEDSDLLLPYEYENFPIRLKSIGAIKKVAYSLFLNNTDSSSGSVLFGAVDHAKYSGQLQTVPIINIYPQIFDSPTSFNIVLDSITIGDSTQNIPVSTLRLGALLDSGTTLTYLPHPVVQSIVTSLNGKATKYGFYEVDCRYNTTSDYITYDFSGVQIRVPLSDLIMSAEVAGVNDSKCYLGLADSPNDSTTDFPSCILGDNFLRHAYIVYDLEAYEVSLAQVNYSDSEDIEVISSTVPSAVKAPNYSTSWIDSAVGTQPTATPLTLSSDSQLSSSYTTEAVAKSSVGPSSVETSSVETFSVETSSAASFEILSSFISSPVTSSSEASPSSDSSYGIPSVTSSVTSSVVSSPISSFSASSSDVLYTSGWNTSYVSTSNLAPVSGTPITSSLASLTTETNVVVSTSTNAAGSTVLVTNTYTTTYCPYSSVTSASSSLTTETNVVVSTSTNAAGSTVLITNTYTTTYCPASSTPIVTSPSASSSLTTATNVVVSTSTNAAGSSILVTNTYTTTYCPASATSNTNTTTYVTIVETIGQSSGSQGSGQSVPTTVSIVVPLVSGSQTGLTSQGSVNTGSSTPVIPSLSTTVAGNNSVVSSSSSAPQSSSITILQGKSSKLSFISTILLLPLFALF